MIALPTIAKMWNLVGNLNLAVGHFHVHVADVTALVPEQSPCCCRQNGHQMDQFEGCVGKMNPLLSLTYCQIFQSPSFLKGCKGPAMAAIEAPGSPLSNKLLFVENRQHGHIEWLNFSLVLGKL